MHFLLSSYNSLYNISKCCHNVFLSVNCTAAKTAMNLFSHISEATIREKELMKACTDPELVASIVGNVKITAAGLTQLKQKQKKGKKSAKQGS